MPRLVSVLLTIVCIALAIFGLAFDWGDGESDVGTLAALATVAAAGTVGLRERSPKGVLAIVAGADIALVAATSNEVALMPTVMLVLFSVASTGDRRRSLAVAVSAGSTVALATALLVSDPFVLELLSGLAIVLLPVALGDASRARAERLASLIDAEATSRVQAERLRIARDLHDTVAHGLSTIAIQSGIAAHLMDQDSGQAKEALEAINATGKSSLEELRAMVGVLRSTDELPLHPTPTDPQSLDDVFDEATTAGIVLTTSIDGAFPDDASESVVVAVYRITREALTNVARHAGSTEATVAILHGTDDVQVTITNRQGATPDIVVPSTGMGIVGMTERADSLGGTLTTSTLADGGFRVFAALPYRPRSIGA